MNSEKTLTAKHIHHFYEFGPFRLDPTEKLLLRNGERIPLTLKAFDTLLVLVERHGHIVEKAELMQRIWPDAAVEENNLTQNISAIRRALGDNGHGQQFIETLPRRGYRFVGTVREREGEAVFPTIVEDQEGSLSPQTAPPQSKQWIKILLPTVVVVALAVTSLLFTLTKSSPPAVPQPNLKIQRLANTNNAWETALSPDGSLIAYVVREVGRQSLWLKQVETGQDKELLSQEKMRFRGLAFAPDGKSLYYAQQQPDSSEHILYQKPIQGGEAKRLLEGVDSSVTFSPDGRQIAFVREAQGMGESSLVIANADGTGEKTIAIRKMPKYYAVEGLSWSPDGKRLAVATANLTSNFHFQIVTVSLETGEETPVGSPLWTWAEKVVWVNEGKLVLIGRDKEATTNNKQIWLMDYPSGQARKLFTSLSEYRGLSVSKDGHKLVTIRRETRADIWQVSLQSPQQAQAITADPASQMGSDGLDWTPDGHLIYTSLASGHKNLWIMRADGSQAKPLTTEAQDNAATPSVTANGRQVVFNSGRAGFARVWRIDLDGGSPVELSHGTLDLNPYCSPVEEIVYFSQRLAEKRQIYRLRIDGSEPAQALTDKLTEYPAVSPDGKWIVCLYQETPKAPRQVAIIPASGGAPTQRFDLPVFPLGSLRWHPNGKAITYLSSEDGARNIWQQPLTGEPPQPLTDFKSDRLFAYAWSRDGKMLACSRGHINQEVVMIGNLGN